jgi:hypothetical protein
MTVIIYFTENKKNYQIIHPQTDHKDSKHNFDGRVQLLVEHVTHSDRSEGIKNYHSFEIF